MKTDTEAGDTYTIFEQWTGDRARDQMKELAGLLVLNIMDLLGFIRDYQTKKPDDQGVTKEEIARHMDKAGISSRPTTLKMIQRLLDFGMIVDNKKRNNTFSRLIINPKYDFKNMVAGMLVNSILQIHKKCEPFNNEARGANTVLVKDLLEVIETFMKKEKVSNANNIYTPKPLDQYPTDDIYTPRQLQKMAMDDQKKSNNRLKKRLFGSVRKARNQTGIK